MSSSDSIRDVLDGTRPRVQVLHPGAEPDGHAPGPLADAGREEPRPGADSMAERQAALEGELARYRDLFRLSPDARLVTDTDGLVVEANDAANRMLRPGPAGLQGKPLALFVAPDDRRAFLTVLRGLPHGEAADATLRMSPPGSLPVDVEAIATARSRTRGAPLELHWTLRDVTVRREEAASHDESAEIRRIALDSAPLPLVAMDLDGSVVLWNSAAQRLLGWREEEVLGRRNPALADDEVARSGEAAREGAGEPRRAFAHRSGGSAVPVWVHDAPLVDAAGTARGVVSVLRESSDAGADPADGAGDDAWQEARRRWTREESLRILRVGVAGDRGDVVTRLRTWIASGLHMGYLRPDDRLPSIREVSQECAVDHRAVSAAYRTLAGEGVVEVRSRHGVYVAALPTRDPPGLSETAEWLAGVLGDAGALQLRVPLLPELVRDWTAAAHVSCACVDDTEDGLVALAAELRQQWGLDTYPVPLSGGPHGRPDEAALVAELRRADVVVTTSFHAGRVGAVAAALDKPVVVLRAHPELVQTLEERLAAGPLTAVVADAAYGERLRCVRGAGADGRLRVVTVSDSAALAALDPAEPVLLTRAAQQRLGSVRARLLYPLSPVFCPASARGLAPVLIAANILAGRALA